jgi:hypothetical protein
MTIVRKRPARGSYDQCAAAVAILTNAAHEIAPVMLPVHETAPTAHLPVNGIQPTPVGVPLQAIHIQWPCDGFLVAVMATIRDSNNYLASGTMLRVQVDGVTELFPAADNSGAGWMPFSQISQMRSQYGVITGIGRLEIRRPFTQAKPWVMYVQGINVGDFPSTSDITFFFIDNSTRKFDGGIFAARANKGPAYPAPPMRGASFAK